MQLFMSNTIFTCVLIVVIISSACVEFTLFSFILNYAGASDVSVNYKSGAV